MSGFSVYLDHSLTPWRKYRLRDCINFIPACLLFIAGCAMATMSFKLGASSAFVILYILLGSSGFIMYYFKFFKIMPEPAEETIPLVSNLHSKNTTRQNYKECKATRTAPNSTSPDMKMEENDGSGDTSNTDEKHELSPPTLSASPGNTIKCVESSYHPSIAEELYATSPSPGGGQSRRADRDGQGTSWQRRIPSFVGLFRASPTEPSSQFHIPLTEVPPNQEATGIFEPRSPSPVQDEETTIQWMSSNPHEPIYRNIIPYPDRRRILTESGVFRQLQYDIPSKELRNVEGERRGVSAPINQSTIASLSVESSSYIQEQRDRKKLSQERTYVNVFPWSKERQVQKQSSPPLEGSRIPGRTEDFRRDTDKYRESLFDPLIYANIPYKDQEEVRRSEGIHNAPPHPSRRRDRPETREFWTIKDSGVRSTTRIEPQGEKDPSRISTNTGNLKSETVHNLPLYEEPVYANITSLGQETKNQTKSVERVQDNVNVPNMEKQAVGAESKTPQENVQVNLPFDTANLYVQTKALSTKAKEEVNSESESSAGTETDTSTSGENAWGKEDEAKRQDSNRARSEYMYVTALGPTLKTYVKPGATGTRNIPLEADKDKHLSKKSEYMYVTALGPTLKTYVKPGATVNRNIPLEADKHLSKKLVADVDNSIARESSVVAKSKTLPSYGGTRARESNCNDRGRNFPNRTYPGYPPLLYPTEIVKVPSEKNEQNVSSMRSPLPKSNKSNPLLHSESEEEDFSKDEIYHMNEILPLTAKSEEETKSNFTRATTLRSSIRQSGSDIKRPLSETACSKPIKRESLESESTERKCRYENPLYGANMSITEDKAVETEEEVRRSVTMEETDKKSSNKEKPNFQKLSTFQKQDVSDQLSDVTEIKSSSMLNEIACSSESAKSSRFGELKASESLPQVHADQPISSLKINAITTSEDEDYFCLLKSLNRIPETKDSRLDVSENFMYSEDSYSTSLSKSIHASPPHHETDAQGLKRPKNVFSPKKQGISSTSGRMSAASMKEQPSGRVLFNTPLEIPSVKPSRSHTIMPPMLPRNVPPLNRFSLRSESRSLHGKSPPTMPIDLPVILNRSTIVQSQLEKFTQDYNKLPSKSSVQLSKLQPLTRSSRSCEMLLPSKSEVRSACKSLPSADTKQHPGFKSGLLPTLPSMENLKGRPGEQSSTTQPKAQIVTDRQPDISDTKTHDYTTSASKRSEESSGRSSVLLPRHLPVYF